MVIYKVINQKVSKAIDKNRIVIYCMKVSLENDSIICMEELLKNLIKIYKDFGIKDYSKSLTKEVGSVIRHEKSKGKKCYTFLVNTYRQYGGDEEKLALNIKDAFLHTSMTGNSEGLKLMFEYYNTFKHEKYYCDPKSTALINSLLYENINCAKFLINNINLEEVNISKSMIQRFFESENEEIRNIAIGYFGKL